MLDSNSITGVMRAYVHSCVLPFLDFLDLVFENIKTTSMAFVHQTRICAYITYLYVYSPLIRNVQNVTYNGST